MVHLKIGTMEWDAQLGKPVARLLAEVTVNGWDVKISGDERYFDTRIGVIEPDTGRALTFDEDPELWAKNLQHAHRMGDITIDFEEVKVPATAAQGVR